MKLRLFILVAVLGLFTACNEHGTNSNENGKSLSTQPTCFYRRMEGTIAGHPVVMNLQKINDLYYGVYYYKGKSLFLSLNGSAHGDSILLTESAPSGSSEEEAAKEAHFYCLWQNGKMVGSWASADGSKTFPLTLTENYPAGSYKFDYYTIADSVKYHRDSINSRADVSYSLPVPNNASLNSYVKSWLEFKDTNASIPEGINQLVKAYCEDYNKTVQSDIDSFGGTGEQLNYEHSETMSVRFNDHGYVILENAVTDYSGGAHGNYWCRLSPYDMQAHKPLKLSDIITADSATLQPFVEKYFRIQYNIADTDSLGSVLFENHLGPNNNFYFNERGLGFIYNPYEVASYAQGQIEVFVPFHVIKQYLVPAFAKRLE